MKLLLRPFCIAGFVTLSILEGTLTALSYVTHPDQSNSSLDELRCKLVGHTPKTDRHGDTYCRRCYGPL